MKYLIWLLILGGFWWWWRHQQRTRVKRPPPPPQSAQAQAPQEMGNCAACGLHLPRQDAVSGRLGVYCSEEHRARHEA